MDAVDKAMYENQTVDDVLYRAYSEVFNGSESAQMVLSDLIKTCQYGVYSPDPDSKLRIFERSTVILRIKSILNGIPEEQQEDEVDENE